MSVVANILTLEKNHQGLLSVGYGSKTEKMVACFISWAFKISVLSYVVENDGVVLK